MSEKLAELKKSGGSGGNQKLDYKVIAIGEGSQYQTITVTALEETEKWMLVCRLTTNIQNNLTLTIGGVTVDVSATSKIIGSDTNKGVFEFEYPIKTGDTITARFSNGGGSYFYILSV